MPAENDTDYVMEPVAFVRCRSYYRYEVPRQASFSEIPAEIVFRKGENFETALEDLAGFERIWVVFVFHLNCGWSPKVRPPLSPDNAKYGVFATRSPHRPNRIGLSCVRLLGVSKNVLQIENSDMLDGTPVLDVKPYIPDADSFPDSAAGWRDRLKSQEWKCSGIAAQFQKKSDFLSSVSTHDLLSFARVQLRYNPTDASRKRIEQLPDGSYTLGYRTWRLVFTLNPQERSYFLRDVYSNYEQQELLPGAEDPYSDKDLHRAFLSAFPQEQPENKDHFS